MQVIGCSALIGAFILAGGAPGPRCPLGNLTLGIGGGGTDSSHLSLRWRGGCES